MEEHDPRLAHYFTPFVERAKALIAAPSELPELATRAQRKLGRSKDVSIRNVRDRADRVARFVKAQAEGGGYRSDAGSLELAVASLVYFISPNDQIPDPLPAGQADDAAVFAFVARTLADEIDRALGTS